MSEAAKHGGFDPQGLVRYARIITLTVAAGAALYLGLRFDLVTLPVSGCSPVSRFSPGSRLLVDRWADAWTEGDEVFVIDSEGVVHLALLGRTDHPGRWRVLGDSSDCPGLFPEDEGPVAEASILGRVVLSLGR